MATYAIGDIQGCYRQLMQLLEIIQFSETSDTLWFAGDLVNRGEDSLSVLRMIYRLPHKVIVLGNHDLHLLALYFLQQQPKPQDTLTEILQADDCEELCHWLIKQPLIHHDSQLNYTLVHAGIHPSWSLDTACSLSDELYAILNSEQKYTFFQHMYGNEPTYWQPQLSSIQRWRFITNVFTRMRFLTSTQALELTYKGDLKHAPKQLIPWFKFKRQINSPIIFGHWAALNCQTFGEENIYPIDSGCVWGNYLTALRLDDGMIFHR